MPDMEIVSVNQGNVDLLKYFIENLGTAATSFRYYNSRSADSIKNHLTTLLIVEKGMPVAYGHLDVENNITWLGICVLPELQGKGLGDIMMKELVQAAKKSGVSKIYLTVDRSNANAISLYKKYNFQKEVENEKAYTYSLVFFDQ